MTALRNKRYSGGADVGDEGILHTIVSDGEFPCSRRQSNSANGYLAKSAFFFFNNKGKGKGRLIWRLFQSHHRNAEVWHAL